MRAVAHPPGDAVPRAGDAVPDLLVAQRRHAILDLVRERGVVRSRELSGCFGVSMMTIHRDLRALAHHGHLRTVHGGAVARTRSDPAEAATPDRPAPDRSGHTRPARRAADAAIAARAATMVHPGAVVALSPGDAPAAMVPHLLAVPGLCVATNAVGVAALMNRAARPDQTVILTGGVRTGADCLTGTLTVAAIGDLRVDLYFLGVEAMGERAGLTAASLAEAEVARAWMASARRTVVLAGHDRWDGSGVARIAGLDAVDTVITDARMAGPARRALQNHVGTVVVAEGSAAPTPGLPDPLPARAVWTVNQGHRRVNRGQRPPTP
jgi:DeoR/GlpR family transcriptional regulator of sugar metabolism